MKGREEGRVLAADRGRFHAMIKGDLDALDGLLADDLTYTHSDGRTETKAEFLAALKSGRLVYERIEPKSVQVRLFDLAAVVTGRSHLWVRLEGKSVDFSIRHLAVYERRGGQWRLLAWQSTRPLKE